MYNPQNPTPNQLDKPTRNQKQKTPQRRFISSTLREGNKSSQESLQYFK